MQQKIAILDDSMINTLLEQQQKILNLLQHNAHNRCDDMFCDVRQAAEFLNVSQQKIRQMVDNNELKYKKIGKKIRIYRSSLM